MMGADGVVLVIPTLGRVHRQQTLRELPAAWHERTWLAVPESEAAQHTWPQLLVHPNLSGIGVTRQWIFDTVQAPYILCFDDDCNFNVRRQYDPPRLQPARGRSIEALLARLRMWLERGVAMVGVSARQMNDKEPVCCTGYPKGRLYRAWGYRRAVVAQLAADGFRFDAVHSVDDFHLALTILRAGYSLRVTYHWAHDDRRGSGAAGGCALNRTPETQARDAQRLSDLHPGYVVPVERRTHTTWRSWGTRMDMAIQWQQAFWDGRRRYPDRAARDDCDCNLVPRLV